MTLAEYLKTENLRPEDFGKSIQVSAASVYRYIDGTRMPRVDTLRLIVEATGGKVSPNDFVPLTAPFRMGTEA